MKALTFKKLISVINPLEQLFVHTMIKDGEEYIAIGRINWIDIFTIHKKSLKVTCYLNTYRNSAFHLKVEQIVNSERIIHDIINGDDIIENPVIVYSEKNGEIIQTEVDTIMINVDRFGNYLGETFLKEDEAVQSALVKYRKQIDLKEHAINHYKTVLEEKSKDLSECNNYLAKIESKYKVLVTKSDS